MKCFYYKTTHVVMLLVCYREEKKVNISEVWINIDTHNSVSIQTYLDGTLSTTTYDRSNNVTKYEIFLEYLYSLI